MKRYLLVLFVFLSLNVFSEDEAIGAAFLSEKFHISNYSVYEVPFTFNDVKTLLFYDQKSIISDDNRNNKIFYIKNAVIVSLKDHKVFQYLKINEKGIISSNYSVLFDFSEPGYQHISFTGWLLFFHEEIMDNKKILACNFQLTYDGIERIPADPPLTDIYLYTKYDYPVVYDHSYHGLKIEAEWRENILISIARGGLLKESELGEPEMAYDEIRNLSAQGKRIVRNALFALYGYSFKSKELDDYFRKFFWYKPNPDITNDINILDENQKRLLEFLQS